MGIKANTNASFGRITARQVATILDSLGGALRDSELRERPIERALKHRPDFLIARLLATLTRFERGIGRKVVFYDIKVDRSLPPRRAIPADESWNGDELPALLDAVPRGKGGKVGICFFSLPYRVNNEELILEYAMRGLVPADPYTLAAYNKAHRDFAQHAPNVTVWKDSSGRWCHLIFSERNFCWCIVDACEPGEEVWSRGSRFAGMKAE